MRTSSIGLPTLLFLIFLVLRLTDNITWAWYWVAAPLWMPLAAALTVALIALPAAVLLDMRASRRNRARIAARKAALP